MSASNKLLRIPTAVSTDQRVRRALAVNIKTLMEARNWKQQDLARASGVAQRTISNILNVNSTHSPTLKNVAAIARAFDTSPWLLLIPGGVSHTPDRHSA